MKKILIIFALILGLTSCTGKAETNRQSGDSEKDCVEVIYFHGKQRCATCMAI